MLRIRGLRMASNEGPLCSPDLDALRVGAGLNLPPFTLAATSCSILGQITNFLYPQKAESRLF